jgi:hypothetical protein
MVFHLLFVSTVKIPARHHLSPRGGDVDDAFNDEVVDDTFF